MSSPSRDYSIYDSCFFYTRCERYISGYRSPEGGINGPWSILSSAVFYDTDWNGSLACLHCWGLNMDAGTLCPPQGDKVQFDRELIKHECDTKDVPRWVCDPPRAGNICKNRTMNGARTPSCLPTICRTWRRMDPSVSHCAFVKFTVITFLNLFFFFFLNIKHFGVENIFATTAPVTWELKQPVTQGHIKRNLYFIYLAKTRRLGSFLNSQEGRQLVRKGHAFFYPSENWVVCKSLRLEKSLARCFGERRNQSQEKCERF